MSLPYLLHVSVRAVVSTAPSENAAILRLGRGGGVPLALPPGELATTPETCVPAAEARLGLPDCCRTLAVRVLW